MYKNLKNVAESSMQNNVIDEYVKTNNKSLIPELLDIIESDDELFEANETAKSSCTLLYRGLALDKSIPDTEIVAYDMQQDYVSYFKV